MKAIVIAALAAAAACAPATAQSPAAAAPIVATPRAAFTNNGTMLPSNTEIVLSPNTEITSKSVKVGDKIAMSVARDVMLGDYVVIPRGTPASGTVSYRTGKGAFGKSAKMEFDLTDISLAGRSIPLSGHYRIEGQGNTGAAVGAAVAVGPFGAFVTGRSAVIGQNTEWKGFTREPLAVALAPAASGAPTLQPAVTPAPTTIQPVVIKTSATTSR